MTKRLTIWLVCCVSLVACGNRTVQCTGAACAPDDGALWVYLLAGQSNMVGLGLNSEIPASEARPVDKTTIYYDDGPHQNYNAKRWLPLAPGFGVTTKRFGPELSFGQRLRQLWPKRELAFIKVAESNTALADRWAARSGDLYKTLVSTARTGLEKLHQQHKVVRLAGLVWMQGESDAGKMATASTYGQHLTTFVQALRADLGAPNMPIIAGLIATKGGWRYATLVRGATMAVAKQLSHIRTVDTADLPLDRAHYNAAANLTLGRRFADAAATSLVP